MGFVLGPARADRTWEKAFDKVSKRSALWGSVGLGLYFAAVAFNIYVLSTLGFLLQLDVLPTEWAAVEAKAFHMLVPGPMSWALPDDLHRLRRDSHFPCEFGDAREVSLAAKFRVAFREARSIDALWRRVETAAGDSPALARKALWSDWLHWPLVRHVQDAVR